MEKILSWIETWYAGGGFTVKLFDAGMIILIAFILDRILCALVDRALRRLEKKGDEDHRRITLARVICRINHYVLSFIAFVMILSIFGVNVVSILAAAGVVGLAVSFGAQSLIKDIFAGFFILLEDQYGVGEYVTVNQNFTGIVELIDLRVTRLRGDDGELIIIPNGTITDVVNYCRGSLRIKEVFEISYDSNIGEAEAVILAAAKDFYREHKDLLFGEPVVEGVEEIGTSGVSICLIMYCRALEKWHIGREARKMIVQSLQNAGIEIPYPVTEVITREENDEQ